MIENEKQLAAAMSKELRSMGAMDRKEWFEILYSIVEGKLDAPVKYWAKDAERIGLDENYVRLLLREITDSIISSEEYDEISKFEEYDREFDEYERLKNTIK